MGTPTTVIDEKRYGRLLAKALPRVIDTEAERDRAVAIVEALIEKGEAGMTAEDDALLELLTSLINSYEATAYPRQPKQPASGIVAFCWSSAG